MTPSKLSRKPTSPKTSRKSTSLLYWHTAATTRSFRVSFRPPIRQAAPRYAKGLFRLPTRNGHHPRRRHFIGAGLRFLPGISRLRHRLTAAPALARHLREGLPFGV